MIPEAERILGILVMYGKQEEAVSRSVGSG